MAQGHMTPEGAAFRAWSQEEKALYIHRSILGNPGWFALHDPDDGWTCTEHLICNLVPEGVEIETLHRLLGEEWDLIAERFPSVPDSLRQYLSDVDRAFAEIDPWDSEFNRERLRRKAAADATK